MSSLHHITVHVDEVQRLVAIEWPDQSGVMVVDPDGRVDDDRLTVPPHMTTLEAPKEPVR